MGHVFPINTLTQGIKQRKQHTIGSKSTREIQINLYDTMYSLPYSFITLTNQFSEMRRA